MPIKLIISDRIEFDVKFSLNDGGTEKPFGIHVSAKRLPLDQLQEEMSSGVVVGEFLKARGLTMMSWIGGKCPLADEEDNPVPPGEDALQALYTLVGGMVSLIYAGYLEANGAKGRSGN